MSVTPPDSTGKSRPYTGAEYLESIRDGREVWIYGERVDDITTHPAFRNNARMVARLYDALHDPQKNAELVVPTDTGSTGFTHPYYRVPRSSEDLQASVDAMTAWARMTYGWMGRTPDFKAAFLATLGSNTERYGPYAANAEHWYREAQEKVLFVGHAIVNPPIDRDRGIEEVKDVYLTVDEETEAGLVVSGAKVVGTSAALTQYIFVGNYGMVPAGAKEFSAYFIVPTNAPGLKIISRASYEFSAAVTGSPFDQPLSSRMDENDGIMVFDRVLVPWENVFCYDVDKANDFFHGSGFYFRSMLHGCVRLGVKLDFLTGLLAKGLDATGAIEFRGVQTRLGEVLSYRHTLWALVDSMVRNPTHWPDGTVVPNTESALAYRVFASTVYPKVKEIFLRDLGSALVYSNSHANDWGVEELRPYLDTYVRGRNGMPAVERVKLMKLIWDAVGSEFGGRWELYEMNYAGSHENIRIEALKRYQATGGFAHCTELVEQCLSDYDVNGWTSQDLAGPEDVSVIGGHPEAPAAKP
ncbi:4-hydroxyphenylacetate 3-hydroxylase family protein [Streptomyces sp. NPDC059398]|uniref:4-hydroxyphenylacetate 3-hydroxylase family protein n=1 Tax=Streptomyces sp. NPDC059398 TaxID=3346820 RepID=UPI0036C52F93